MELKLIILINCFDKKRKQTKILMFTCIETWLFVCSSDFFQWLVAVFSFLTCYDVQKWVCSSLKPPLGSPWVLKWTSSTRKLKSIPACPLMQCYQWSHKDVVHYCYSKPNWKSSVNEKEKFVVVVDCNKTTRNLRTYFSSWLFANYMISLVRAVHWLLSTDKTCTNKIVHIMFQSLLNMKSVV